MRLRLVPAAEPALRIPGTRPDDARPLRPLTHPVVVPDDEPLAA